MTPYVRSCNGRVPPLGYDGPRQRASLLRALAVVFAMAAVAGCEVTNVAPEVEVPIDDPIVPVEVTVSPTEATLEVGTEQVFRAEVSGTTSGDVTWSTTCGRFTELSGSRATYVAPMAVTECELVARSVADPTASADASVLVEASTTGAMTWITQAGDGMYTWARAIALHDDGDVVVAARHLPTGGETEVLVVRLTDTGDVRWQRTYSTDGDWIPSGLVLDADGNAYVAGTRGAAADDTSGGVRYGFLLKIDPEGDPLWDVTIQVANYPHTALHALAADTLGTLYVAGTTHEIEGIQDDPTLAGPPQDAFLATYDATGAQTSLFDFRAAGGTVVHSVAVSADGSRVVLAGRYVLDDDGWDAWTTSTLFVITDPGGPDQVARPIQGAGPNYAADVALHGASGVVVTGTTSVPLGEDVVDLARAAGFVMLLDADLVPEWTHYLDSAGNDNLQGVEVDGLGHIVVVGETSGDLFGSSVGQTDTFVAKLDAAGDVKWAHQYGTTASDRGAAVAVGSDRRIVKAGTTRGTLGGNRIGIDDLFVARHAP